MCGRGRSSFSGAGVDDERPGEGKWRRLPGNRRRFASNPRWLMGACVMTCLVLLEGGGGGIHMA